MKENLEDILKNEKIVIISSSEEETKKIGEELTKKLNFNKVPTTVILTGELGTGKTKITEGILRVFGYEDQISSPTFTIVNEYMDYENEEKMKVYHFDVCRLNDYDEFYDMGGDEYFGKGLCLIEWGEIIEDIIYGKYYKITIEKNYEDENISRKITVELKQN